MRHFSKAGHKDFPYLCGVKNGDPNGDYYFNEEGLLVFTEQYHLKRGYCCGCACKHCPYNHVNVPKDKKAKNNHA